MPDRNHVPPMEVSHEPQTKNCMKFMTVRRNEMLIRSPWVGSDVVVVRSCCLAHRGEPELRRPSLRCRYSNRLTMFWYFSM